MSIEGGAGDDTLTTEGSMAGIGLSQIVASGGDGNDHLDLDDADVVVSLDGGDGDDELVGGDLGDSLSGGAGDDEIDGDDGADSIDGGAGNDRIGWFDDEGNDSIDGGSGDDELLISEAGTPGAALDVSLGAGAGGNATLSATSGTDNDLVTFDNVETVTIDSDNGADRVTISDLSATDVDLIVGDLGDAGDTLAASAATTRP